MKFTLGKEENNKINFLDITIAKGHDSPLFDIYSKPTTTDVIIPNDSCHPGEHKTAEIRYFYNRIKSFKLTPESQQKERNTIQQIFVNNNYEASTLNKILKAKKQKETLKKENGQSSHTSGRKRDLLQSCLRIPTSKSHSPQTTLLKDAWQRNIGLTTASTTRVACTS